MNLRQASVNPGAPSWGSLALVTYLPEPLGSFLTGLRQTVPGESTPEAHITFLPPRPLSTPIQVAESKITELLEAVKPFELELGTVQLFPQTNIIYLDIQNGREELLTIHDSLNQGDLFADENFEYIPHITLGGPLSASDADQWLRRTQQAWDQSGLSPRFCVTEAVLLWQPGLCSEPDWERISAHSLTTTSLA